METKTIGKFIAILRKANGMTQKELAEQLNVSDKAVSRWERDESLPDLTLIPVIAELFGVTADELLRGERKPVREQKLVQESDSGEESCSAEEAASIRIQQPPDKLPVISAKGEKQIAHMLSDGKTKLMFRSMISVGLCIAGFIAALIANFGFYRGYIGFFISCAFYAAAILCEVCFCISAFGKVSGDEFESEALNRYKYDSLNIVTIITDVTIILFGVTLPLVIFPWDAYEGLTFPGWAVYAPLFGGIFAIAAWILSMIIPVVAERKGIYRLSGKNQILRSQRRKLKLKITGIIMLIIAGTAIGQAVFNVSVPVSSLVEGTVFTDFESFKAYMEADVYDETYDLNSEESISGGYEEVISDEYEEVISNEYAENISGEYDGYEDYEEIEWTNDNGKTWETMEYIWRNTTVEEVITGRKSGGKWEVRVLTNDDYEIGESKKDQINFYWEIAYILEIAAGFPVYLRKRKALS